MADEMVRYAKKHGKALVAILAAVFTAGGMFAKLQATTEDVEDNKAAIHSLELRDAKMDAMADDIKLIKGHLIK